MATCSANFNNIGLSGLASGACAASPASACCSVYCARTGIALKRDWNVGTSIRFSAAFRDLPSCANNPSIARTSSSSTLNPPPPVPAPAPGIPAIPEGEPPPCNKAEAVSHFPGLVPSAPPAATPPPPPNPPPPVPPPPPPVPIPPPVPLPPPSPPVPVPVPPLPPDPPPASHKPEPPPPPPLPGTPEPPPAPIPPPADPPEPPSPKPGPAPPGPCPGPPIPPPPPPERMLSAARIICSILFGSSKKSLNLSPAAPSTFCVSCAATLMPATEESSAT